MKILMLGWEFPPAKTGGLGTHCYELVKNLSRKGIKILLLIPKRTGSNKHKIPNVEIIEVGSFALNPYNSKKPDEEFEKGYGWNFFEEVKKFNKMCVEIAKNKEFDIIHCHDWMTVSAGIELKKITRKPLVFTIHSTEYDRTANIYPMKFIVDVEKNGIEKADLVITVSKGMKKQLIERYNAKDEKIVVIYNGIDPSRYFGLVKKNNKGIILFLGRLTNQKGPYFFLHTAKKVLEKRKDVMFIVAGQGDQMPELIKLAIDLNIMDNIIFTGYLTDEEVLKAYSMADVYVMPSVSEPFGITALEAIASGTPVIVSKNAGVAEKIMHCFKVDFWDTHEIANKIICLLQYPVLKECMRKNSYKEIMNFGWDKVAKETISAYRRVS